MSLFTALHSTSEALGVFERSIDVVQNNVVNASTPGYARQRETALAKSFQPEYGVTGGVDFGPLANARDEFAERVVRRQNSLFGRYQQSAAALAQAESNFDVSGTTGLPRAINDLFSSFSALTVTPNDQGARDLVLRRAQEISEAFRSVASDLAAVQAEARRQVGLQVDEINRLAQRLADYNRTVRDNSNAAADPGLAANAYSDLEDLSSYVDLQVIRQPDGSFEVLGGGQVPLVIAERAYPLTADLSSGPQARLFDAHGNEATSLIQGGRVAGALSAVNDRLPSYLAEVHRLARTLADTVNAQLAAGIDNQSPPQPGTPLFVYDAPANAAATLAAASLSARELAAATAAAPGGNGNALLLAELSATVQLDDLTFAGFYGKLAARVGADKAAADDNQQTYGQLTAQARVLRQEQQGVSLDEEAAHLLELQRAYQATAKVFQVIDSLTETTIALLR